MSDEARTIEVPALRSADVALATELSTKDIVNRLHKIEEVQRQAMKSGIDYGVIPGTGGGKEGKGRPTLLKPGAEKLCVLFMLDAQFENERVMDGVHMTVFTKCSIYHQATGQRLGGANAMCSTRETKYGYRKGERLCPLCAKATIIKPKARPGHDQQWWCNKYKDGCGTNFDLDDPAITTQVVGRIVNEDVADQFPTVLRMAEKRALVAAVRLVTGASAIFDEEMAEREDDRSEDDAGAYKPNPEAAGGGISKPTDLCTLAQRAALMKVAKEKLGDTPRAAEWMKERCAKDGIKKGADLTVGVATEVLKELLAMNRGEENQDAGPDAELDAFKTPEEQTFEADGRE